MSQDKDKKIGDVFRKVVSSGITAAFQSEEAIRSVLQDLPLPKEIVSGLIQNAKNSKDEFISSVKNELKGYLAGINITEEIEKVLDRYDLDVRVSFKRKETTKDAPSKKK